MKQLIFLLLILIALSGCIGVPDCGMQAARANTDTNWQMVVADVDGLVYERKGECTDVEIAAFREYVLREGIDEK